jgi:N-acetylglucosaminyldiphosphoundecaprenol N-acetyl-beta-D-mannosaminyltransferase
MGGAALDLLREDDLLRIVADRRDHPRRPLVIASSNLEHIRRFGAGGDYRDPAEDDRSDWLVTADGMPVVWAARWLTREHWPQLAGSDLLPVLLRLAEERTWTVGFAGGWDEQHAGLRKVLARRFPGLRVAGYWTPSANDLDDRERSRKLALDIADSRVDLLVVSLGKPKQELWLSREAEASGARVALAFGAAADFLAGTATRAPTWVARSGFEWLHRLILEPGRLWRRYLVDGPVALFRLLRHSSLAASN